MGAGADLGNASAAPDLGRCAGHPSRPAHDACPTCGRPRCDADVRALGARCTVCGAAGAALRPPAVVLVGSAATGTVVAVVGAAVGQEYVGARFFSWGFPALVGILAAVLAASIGGAMTASTRHATAVVCAAYAGISALLDFRFTHEPYGPTGRWLPPLVAALVAGAAAAELLARRPAQVRSEARSGRSSR